MMRYLKNNHNFAVCLIDNILQEWALTPENGGNIQVRFVDFDLQDKSCEENDYFPYDYVCTCVDYVEVFYGSYSEKFCGDKVPRTITSCGSSMVIKFHSDGGGTAAGFRAEWEELLTPCPTIIVSHEGFPNSNYPNNAAKVTYIQ